MKDTLVDEFMARYHREYDHYARVAQTCHEQCASVLKQRGIRAIVSSRAKDRDRLKPKIEALIAKGIKIDTVQDIYDSVVDLAGVRIALYFPGDVTVVEQLIRSNFNCVHLKSAFPLKAHAVYTKQFSGYKASHFHIYLIPESGAQDRYCETKVEIQVASVLMHAWSEVEHDLIYKPFSGDLSASEHAILDEINGLVLTGEIALQRLQDAVTARVSKDKSKPFGNHYELARYLSDHMAEIERSRDWEPEIGDTAQLFGFMNEIGKANPAEVDMLLKGLSQFSNQPVSEQIAKQAFRQYPSTVEVWDRQSPSFRALEDLKKRVREFAEFLKRAYEQYAIDRPLKDVVAKDDLNEWIADLVSALYSAGLISDMTHAIIMELRTSISIATRGTDPKFIRQTIAQIEYDIRMVTDEVMAATHEPEALDAT